MEKSDKMKDATEHPILDKLASIKKDLDVCIEIMNKIVQSGQLRG